MEQQVKGKGKVVPTHAMKTYGKNEIQLHSFLNMAHGGCK